MMKAKVKASQTLALLQTVRELRAKGVDIASFAAGEPDFPTPALVVDAAYESMKKGNTKYVSTQGEPPLRAAIARDYRERLGAGWVQPENVIVTAGAKQGIYLILASLLDAGDEVLVPAPYWVSYPSVVESALGIPVLFETQESKGFFPTVAELDAKLSPKTKALIFSSPCNPTGTMISREHLKQIVDWCVSKKVTLIYDELYERLILEDGREHVSASALVDEAGAEYVIGVNAFSKTMSMTGWRVGWAVTSKGNMGALVALQSQMMTSLPGFVQDAATVGFSRVGEFLPGFVELFRKRLRILLDGLNSISGLRVLKPAGAFYVFADVSSVMKRKGIGTDKEFCEILLKEKHVALLAGSGSGMPGWVRFSFATHEDEIRKGLERLRAFCA